MKSQQISQLDDVKMVIFHEPHIVQTLGYVHPLASLFEQIPDFIQIKKSYQLLKTILKKYNIHYAEVTDILRRDKNKLIQLAKISCKYVPDKFLEQEKNPSITEEYKNSVLQKLDIESLLSMVFSRPKVYLKKQRLNSFISIEKIEINPLSNLIFTRDQQIVTAKGLVIGNTGTTVRRFESDVLSKCFEILKIKQIGRCPQGCYIQGGDFITIKKDLALLHIGIRSNIEGANYLMQNDLLGSKRFGVVKDEVDRSQQRMHLDTIFNVIDQKNVIFLDFDDPIIPLNARRSIDIYQRNNEGKYQFKFNKDFETFISEEGYNIIKVSHKEQQEFMINFLNIGKFDGKYVLLTSNRYFADLMKKNKIDVEVEYIQQFKQVNKLHGSFHCATQVFR